MPRQRLTRQAEQGKKASPPPQMPAVDRTEGPASPAYYPDPAADKYENGDTSSWAEDPHKPMEPESPPPAMPGNLTTEKIEHPAATEFQKKPETPEEALEEGGGGGKQASEQPSLKKMAEARASLALRIAAALMPNASAHEVELKAVDLMDLEDDQLRATATTLNVFSGKNAAKEDDKDEEFEEGEESEGTEVFDEGKAGGKKAAHEVTARLDRLEASFGRLVKAMGHFFGMEDEEDDDKMSNSELMAYLMAEDMDGDGIDQSKNDYPQGYDVEKMSQQDERDRGEESEGTELFDEGKMAEEDEEEAMLRAMLEEMDEEMAVTASAAEETTEPLAKGQSIQSGEGGNVNPDEYAPTPVVAQSDGEEKVGDPSGKKASEDDTGMAENDIEITAGADPLGLMESDKQASADDELLALYADLDLPKTAGEEEEEEEEVEEVADDDAGTDEKAEKDDEEYDADDEGKKASEQPKLKPQPKTASTGAQRVGAVPGNGIPKTARSEIADLEKLWETAPNVSEVFGLPKS